MQFRQQRRRRVWPDEVTQFGRESDDPDRSADGDAAGSRRRETYTSHARRDEQPRLTDLIPTRYRVLAAWYAGGGAVIGLLETLYARRDWLAAELAPVVPRALDLAQRTSFAAWCSSAWLSITALVSVLIYSLRRHRVDDVRGRYRIWIWTALGWMALAVNQTAPWDELMSAVLLRGGTRIGLNQAWLWPTLCGGVALACALRLSVEMRASRLSLALLWSGGLIWLAGAICRPLTADALTPDAHAMLVAGLTLSGQWTILWAHLTYARHVVLDAHGLLAPRTGVKRPRLARRTRKVATDGSAGAGAPAAKARGGKAATGEAKPTDRPAKDSHSTTAKTPLAAKPVGSPTLAPIAKTAPATKPASAAGNRLGVHEVDDDADEDSSDADLSRTERKRLKRQQRGQIRKAA